MPYLSSPNQQAMNMPIMNGREFLAAYEQLSAIQQQAKIIMLTTSVHEQDQLGAGQLPVADFLSKPPTRAKMTDLLARYFA